MRNRTNAQGGQQDLANDPVRWGRFLSELARHACNLCPDSVSQALEEITSRCYKLFYVQEGGQSVFRVSPVIENLSRFQLWHNYSAFAFACATASKQENSPRKGLTVKGMMQLVLAAMRASQVRHQQLLARRHCSSH